MISSKRFAEIARKWLRATAARRKRITFHARSAATTLDSDACSTSAPARKGHFVVYSSDGRRYDIPLMYLKNDIVMELLRMSEEVVGLPGDGPITLPWDATFVGSVVSCLRRRSSRDAEKALLAAMTTPSCLQDSMGPCSILVNHPQVVCEC
ncbi:hypothetical protein Taro_051574 [Colocasia esculenta]|uniref:Uncharacterized protein n=1 Tax=Colocasia esculenta TaxID=4460 RepID=A0A843XGF7_COLES|nr:hypothetical protein [Colocasia esculenta]